MTAAIVDQGGARLRPRAFGREHRTVAAVLRRLGGDGGQTVTEYGIVLGILLPLLAVAVAILLPGIQAVVTAAANDVAGILG